MRTLLEIRTEVIEDLDLQDNDLINNNDVDRWINKGIRIAQADIITIHEPYFLSYYETPITEGSDLYDYPSDIYANKIKSIVMERNNRYTFRVDRIKNLSTASAIQSSYKYIVNSTGGAGWVPLNTINGGRKIQLIPKPTTGILKIWYIRNSKKLIVDSDICDIDEFEDYVIAFAKMRALQKDSNPMFVEAKNETNELRVLMNQTLEDMILDSEDNKLVADHSFYEGEL